MVTQEQAITIASEFVRRKREWEPRLCHVLQLDPSKYPAPMNAGKNRWAVVFWYPDVSESKKMDPSTYTVHVDAETGAATLIEE